MESPNNSQPSGKRLSTSRKLLGGALPFVALLINGCTSDSIWGDQARSQPVYGIYQGATADYTRGGAVGRIVDNGFSVDGDDRVAVPEQHKAAPAPADTLSGSGKDNLEGKKHDTLEEADSSLDSSTSPVDSKDPLDARDTVANGSDGVDVSSLSDGENNFFTYRLTGSLLNATIQVNVNGKSVLVEPGYNKIDISDDLKHGMNRVSFIYTPVDETSRVSLSVMRDADPPLPANVTFDSAYDTYQDSDTHSYSKVVYFLAQ